VTPPLILKPIAALADLRIAVLAANRRRSPRWGFRLAPDLVMQLQPKSVVWEGRVYRGFRQEEVRFDGAVEYAPEGVVSADVFQRSPGWRDPRMRLPFTVIGWADTPESWELQPGSCRFSKVLRHGWGAVRDILVQRLHAAFTSGTFERFQPSLMLRPACLRCGKALTDPASMARWIGPECASTGSLVVPGLVLVDETQPSLLAK
jgi:hypothetical protein